MPNSSAATAINKPQQIAALAGIRGYGFLGIFFGHYLAELVVQHRPSPWAMCLYYFGQLMWLAVPAFFVLSGYLIGGILFRSRNREGFFRVFYGRRALRVLPVCYITIVLVGIFDATHGIHLDYKYWLHFIYLQNFTPAYSSAASVLNSQIIHLWSLAVEEQFYLTWPVIVWLAKDRKSLLKITLAICALCWVLRLIAPWIHISATRGYYATPTRIDAILFGVALSLVVDQPIYLRYRHLAKYVVVVGTLLWLVSLAVHPVYPDNYFHLVVDCSLGDVIVLALIVAALEEGSTFTWLLSRPWACWLGSMSYAMYVFHFTYHNWFLHTLRPMLARHMPEITAYLLAVVLAFALTIALGVLSLRFIEKPALSLKRYFEYGAGVSSPLVTIHPAKELNPLGLHSLQRSARAPLE